VKAQRKRREAPLGESSQAQLSLDRTCLQGTLKVGGAAGWDRVQSNVECFLKIVALGRSSKGTEEGGVREGRAMQLQGVPTCGPWLWQERSLVPDEEDSLHREEGGPSY
jgi:hypothetical protein